MAEANPTRQDQQNKNSNRRFDRERRPQKRPQSQNHILRKRQPEKLETGENVFYVSSSSNIKGLLEKCNKLISNDENEIIIYSLGAAIQRGVLLALQLQEKHVAFQIHTNTFSTELTDDLEPAVDEEDYEIQKRHNAALRIRVFRTDPLAPRTK